MSVNSDFHGDFMLNYDKKLVPLLEDGIRVMIYVGMEVGSRQVLGSVGSSAKWKLCPMCCGILTYILRQPLWCLQDEEAMQCNFSSEYHPPHSCLKVWYTNDE